MTKTIRVIVFQDDGLWVAQCLEYDIGAQGPDVDTLMSRFEVTFKTELKESLARHGKPLAGIEAAPDRFQRMWDHRARSVVVSPGGKPGAHLTFTLDPIITIVKIGVL